jgi:glutaredoxin-related protein
MPRTTLDETHIHPAIRDKVGSADSTLAEVQQAVATHDIVVVGMKQNVFPKKARAALQKKGVPFTYLEYGSYFSEWRKRLTLKMWSGWPTFPMVFVKGTLVGGASELETLINAGELDRLLQAAR